MLTVTPRPRTSSTRSVRRHGPIGAWILPLFIAIACNPGKISLGDTANGGGGDTLTDGAISVSPTALDLGVVFVGQSVDGVVTVENVGDAALDLAASIDSTVFTVTLADTSPGPGATSDLVVSFTPDVFGAAAADLVITDAVSEAQVTVAITATAQLDEDGDGYGSIVSGGEDCDDQNAAAHPDADEIWYDGVDEDCLGGDDYDRDGDGSLYTEDCDDADPTVYPGNTETWYDGIDGDCAGDDDFDQDKDGFVTGIDCNDTDAAINPSAIETWYDGVDQDCDGIDDDQDSDGYGVADDCNDVDATINPGATETWYDGVDTDCSGGSDYDQDGDAVDYPTDCNDTDPTVTGPVDETLNGIDDDCDGTVDDLPIDDVTSAVLYGGSENIGLGGSDSLSLGGDLTGDGADDLVVATDSSGAGYAWIVSGTTAATAAGVVTDYDTASVTGASSTYPMGNLVGPAVDVTGDGDDDLLIAGAGSYGYYSYGYGWVFEGGTSFASAVSASTDYTARFAGDSDGDQLSWLAAGDIDGDGDNDVVTACPYDGYTTSSGGWGGGYDYYTGNIGVFAAGTFTEAYTLDDSSDQIHGADDYDYLGSSLVVADLDGDGYDDIVAGAYGQDDNGVEDGGAIYVFPGNATLTWDARANDAMSATIFGSGRSDYVGGYPLTAPGDVDGDGALDLAFATSAGGEAYLFWNAGSLSGEMSVTDADITIAGTAASFGSALAYASDTDGDGADELWVGDSGNDTIGSNAGAVYRFQPGVGDSGAWTTANATASFFGLATGDALGSGLAGGGDADGDGTDDLLIGATGVDTGASGGGAVYVVLGR